MFTGIIEEVGEVAGARAAATRPCCRSPRARIVDDLEHGASIAVNGVCLTVVGWRAGDRHAPSTSTSWARR